ncbi:MAG: ArnT family glycosyltransferase [Verrucomicrobiia bacterium]
MQEKAAAVTKHEAVERFGRRDWLAAAVLFAASLAIRVPFRSQFAYHWDSAQFALAIEHYDISVGLPHEPGFFLFVMFGRIVNLLVGDPHTSLVWMNLVAGAGLAALGYLLGAALFGRDCGWVTGGILATSPLCWFQSEVVFTTLLDAALVTATILVCWRAIRRGGTWPWVFAAGAILAVQAGVRQPTTPPLCPVWVYTFWKFPQPRWPKFAVGVLVAGLLCAAWFVPMVKMSGGLGMYLRLCPQLERKVAPLTGLRGGPENLINSAAMIVGSCWVGLLGAGVLAAAESLSWLAGKGRQWAAIANRNEELRFLAVWIVPMVVFGLAVYTVMPGYMLCYFPAIAILAAWAISRLVARIDLAFQRQRPYGLITVVAAISLVNCAVFLLPPGEMTWLRGNLPLTATEVRDHDRQLGQWFQAIHGRFRPDEVVICHHNQSYFYGFLHFEYHLPEYENWLLTTDTALRPPFNHQLWRAKNHHVEFMDRFEPREHKTIILVVSPGGRVDEFATVLDVRNAKKWEIPDSAPLYTLTVGAE